MNKRARNFLFTAAVIGELVSPAHAADPATQDSSSLSGKPADSLTTCDIAIYKPGMETQPLDETACKQPAPKQDAKRPATENVWPIVTLHDFKLSPF